MPLRVSSAGARPGAAAPAGCEPPATATFAAEAELRPLRLEMLDGMAIVPYYSGHLCTALQQRSGIHVRLASPTYQHDPEYFTRSGIRRHKGLIDLSYRLSGCPAPVRRFFRGAEYLFNLAALLTRFAIRRPDVVHVQFLPLLELGIAVERWWLGAVRRLGIKVVYTVHNVLPQDGAGRRAAYESVYRLADRLICHDAAAARRLTAEFGIAADRVVTIPHGPLFEAQRARDVVAARRHLGFAPEESVVLWQGILRPYKGVSFLLKAWRIVCEREKGARLAIVGTGEAELIERVRQETRDLGLERRVRLDLRFISVQDLADYYEVADVVVYPYREITTSGALLTGIGRGKAIVASRLPAFEELLRDGETALLVRYGDENALAESLLYLICDRPARERIGGRLAEEQRAIVRWTEIADRTSECYRAVVIQGQS